MAVKIDMPICSVCGKVSELKKRKYITGDNSDNEWVWVCPSYPSCDSYVGCHLGTFRPLGSLAGVKLRTLRWRAHKAFDTCWRGGRMTRTEAYAELAIVLGVEEDEAHIGKLDESQCERVVEVFDGRKPYKVPRII